jgi:hypothetical protein
MAKNRIPNVVLENVNILFPNFAGKVDQFNSQGARKFSIELPERVAADMLSDGWNVKRSKEREGGDPDAERRLPHLAVEISYRLFSPQVTLITGRRRTNLTQTELDILDWADITNVDLVIQPSSYEMNGKAGVKAYLQKMFITIEEDALDKKYADYDDGRSEHTEERSGVRFE